MNKQHIPVYTSFKKSFVLIWNQIFICKQVLSFTSKIKSRNKKHESEERNLIRFHDLYLQKAVIIVTF